MKYQIQESGSHKYIVADQIVHGELITMITQISEFDSNSLMMKSYRPIEGETSIPKRGVTNQVLITDFLNDIELIFNRINNVVPDINGLIKGLEMAVIKHINKHGNIIDSELYCKIDSMLHAQAYLGKVFPEYKLSTNQAMEAFIFLRDHVFELYLEHIHINSVDERKRPVVVKLEELTIN